MKTIRRRILLALLVFLLCLSSCQNAAVTETTEAEKPKTEEKSEPTRYEAMLSDLPSADWQGRAFRIATDSPALVSPSNGASVAGKERLLALKAVEEKYHVTVTLTEESGLPTLPDRLRTEAMAGTSYCDLAVLQSGVLQSMFGSSLLLNVRSVPYLSPDNTCYHAASFEETTFGNHAVAFSGDWIAEPEKYYGVFFNKSLLARTALPDLYELVRENQWDFENFLLYAEEVFSLGKVNGAKVYGFTSPQTSEVLIDSLWAASGMRFLKNDYGARPSLIFDTEDTQTFIRQARNLFFRSGAFLNNPASADSAFRTGTVLFCIAPLSQASSYTGVGLNWGVVPLPKMDINQPAFYTYQAAGHALAAFLKGTPDEAFSGQITRALFTAGKGLSQDLALTTFLNLYYNSPEDGEMMKRIMETPYYDPVAFFDGVDASYSSATQMLLYRVISSDVDFDNLYRQYSKMFNQYIDQHYKS